MTFGSPVTGSSAFAAETTQIASATAASSAPAGEVSIPETISAADAAHYAAIFALQEEGNWRAADAQMAQLTDKILMGTALSQRYLSPQYHTTFAEARAWLSAYADLPDARRIWLLAKSKASRGNSVPAPHVAAATITNDAVRLALPAEPPPITLRPPAEFQAGLDAWRVHKWADAAHHFERVAHDNRTGSWYAAASAFWAARAHLLLREPQKVDGWLMVAAAQPRTFYGLLARHTLGMEPDLKFGPQPLSGDELSQLRALPAGRRALALVQVGETYRAEAELRALSVQGNRQLANAIVALGDLANMPSLCRALGPVTDDRRDEALYPVPRWQPRNGFSVDRALLFALMLQESNFDADAQNGSGAAGLMQLMPQTAKSVARRAGIPLRSVNDLVDPVLNLSLGQEYVKQLIGTDQINGNLILVLAAYNNGPGAIARWQSNPSFKNDPLFFIESLPHTETRLYVEQVLTNMWIYRQRLGEKVPDLDSLAANDWPAYVSADVSPPEPPSKELEQNAASR